MSELASQYVAVVSLLVRHSYFAGGACRDLVFEADDDTATLLRQHRLMVKATDSGFTLVAELVSSLARTEHLSLRFHVFAGDPLFASYTSEVQQLGTPLYFGAEASTSGELRAARTPDTVLIAPRGMERMRRPVMIIDFVLAPQDFQSSSRSVYVPARSLAIQLHARSLHWKYLFFGELARHDLYIEDTDPENPVSFSQCDEPLVNAGKALISRLPLPMAHEPQQRLQLKDRSAGRVLIKRLPNASMKKIGKSRSPDRGADDRSADNRSPDNKSPDGRDSIGGESVYVAEIYINQ